MKILLINPTPPSYLRLPSLPLGIVSIASFLNTHGHRAVIVEQGDYDRRIATLIKKYQPNVVGISAMSYLSCLNAKKITKKIRKYTSVPIIWGGQAPSATPELILREAEPDFVMLGEGEVTWLAVADALQQNRTLFDIEGLAYINDKGLYVCNPLRPVADLFAFPEMDWSLIEPKRYFASFFHCKKMLYLHASKGCPAACIFCSNNRFHQSCNRCRNPQHVIHDIDYLVMNCGADGIYFSDELFCPRRDLRTELCNLLIERDYPLVWGCQMRLGVLNETDIRLMYRAGCRWILFGIESGDENRIQSIKKNINIQLANQTIEWCEKIGITVQASFIIGFPHETREELQKTVDFALSLPASLIAMNILTPLPNSEIYELWDKEFSKIKKPTTIKQFAKKMEQHVTDIVPWNFSSVSMLDLRVIHFSFQWKYFIGKHSVQQESFGIAKKMAKDTVDRIFRHGFRGFIFGSISSAKQLITVLFYSHFFPKIKRQYHLK